MPWREAEFMRIFAPGVGLAALGYHRAELGIGQHIRPWRRGLLRLTGGDYIFASIRRKTAKAIFQYQFTLCRAVRQRWLFAAGVLHQRWHAQHGAGRPLDLFSQGAARI